MKNEKIPQKIWMVLCIVLVVAIAVVIVAGRALMSAPTPVVTAPVETVLPTPETVVEIREVEKLVEVEKAITAATVQDGLRDMGFLVTEEYYFTDVVSYSKIKQFWKIDLGWTESGYVGSYDGTITAGVDFQKLYVIKDEDTRTVTVTLPAAEILSIDIDPESFTLYSEKDSWANPITAEEFNTSLVTLRQNARDKAVERGVLDKAQENATLVVKNFVSGLVGHDYAIIVK